MRATTIAATAAFAIATAPVQAEYSLTVLHINDMHSRFEPITKFNNNCSREDDEEGECFGGVARLKSFLDARRADLANTNVLALDAGDQFQGSLFYTTYKGAAAAELMEAIGFDAMTVGNHEFDDGPEALAAFVDRVSFPVLGGNIVAVSGNLLAGRLQDHAVFERGDEKIGVISAVSTDTEVTSSPGPGIRFTDEVEHLRRAVAELEGLGINKIIALTHVGFPRDMEIAASVPGIDAIVGGHSNTYLSSTDSGADGAYPTWVHSADGSRIPIVQAYAYSKFVGELKIVFDEEGNVVEASGDTHLLDHSVKPDADVTARVTELSAPLEALKNRVIGSASASIQGDRSVCRVTECEMGNLVADALLDRARSQGATIAVINGGGLRASIDPGEITMAEVLTVLPFQDTMTTFRLTGADLIEALENGVSEVEEMKGRFPQVSGLRFTWTRSKAALSGRILDVLVEQEGVWQPIDPAADYVIVSSDYLRSGADGYSVFSTKGMDVRQFGPGVEEIVVNYLARYPEHVPRTDGRIIEQ